MKGKCVLCWLIVCCLLLTPFFGVAAEAVPSWVEERNLVRYRGTAITETERACYTAVTTCDSTRVRGLAEEITAGLTTDAARLTAICRWVEENIAYDSNYAPRPLCSCMQLDLPEAALRTKKTNASGLSALTAQLCRAAGIPAESVGGYRLAPGESWGIKQEGMTLTSDSNHWWNEAYVNGYWLIFDLAEGHFDPPAESFFETHLKLGPISDGTNLYEQEMIYGKDTVAFSRPLDRSITEITVPEKVGDMTVTRLRDFAFSGCKNLSRIALPPTVTQVGDQAFAGTALEEAPDLSAVRAPSFGLFMGCTALKRFDFPAHWTAVSACMFEGCTSLQEVTILGTVTTVGHSAFAETALEEAPDLSATKAGAAGLFRDCEYLKRFDVPRGWKTVPGEMFAGCIALTEVTLPPKVQEIHERVFAGCTALTSVEWPKNLTTVGTAAFAGSGLTEAHLPDSVTKLYAMAFSGCAALEEVTLSAGLTAIPLKAFYNCPVLKEITVPVGVQTIEQEAFEGCVSLNAVTLPEGLLTVGERAFADCTALTALSLPEGLTELGKQAFKGCSGIVTLSLPSTFTKLGHMALSGLSSLQEVTVAKENDFFLSEDGVLFAAYPRTLLLYPRSRPNTSYTIPADVTKITTAAFAGVTQLETVRVNAKIILNDGWDSGETFRDCTSLRRVEFASGTRVLPAGGFVGCTSLTEVNLPPTLTTLSLGVFAGCTALESITVPASVRNFGGASKEALPALQGVQVDEDNPTLGDIDGVVYQKTDNRLVWYPSARTATSYEVPATITTIGKRAFQGAAALRTVILPEGLLGIEEDAFVDTSLTDIRLPESLTYIADTALQNTPWWELQPNGPVYCGDVFYGVRGAFRAKELVIREGTRVLARGSLDSLDSLRRVVIPASVIHIWNEYVSSIPATWIVGEQGSAAETYARRAGCLFVDPDGLTAGDTDGDGKITTTDARLALQYAVNKADEYDLFLTVADVDGDGAYTTTDARLMLQYAVGKTDALTVS